MCAPPFHSWPVLGDEGIGSCTDGWAGHQPQRHMTQGLGEMDSGDGLEGCAQCLHISLFGAGVSRARVQDAAAVKDEEEGMHRACFNPQVPCSIQALRDTMKYEASDQWSASK